MLFYGNIEAIIEIITFLIGDPYDSLKSAIESAPIIIKGTVSGIPEKWVYDDIDFLITTIKVEEILRGKELIKDSEIKIL